METIKTQVNISDNRRLVIDLQIPANIPTGKMDVVLVFPGHQKSPSKSARVLGAYKGRIRIGEDFDEHLKVDLGSDLGSDLIKVLN